MKADVLQAYVEKRMPAKRPSKETLNHSGLIYLASGIDPYEDTQNAYLRAYESLGIDVLNRVPSRRNVKKYLIPGESMDMGNGYTRAYLGLYDTFFRNKYPVSDVDMFFEMDSYELNYNDYITPVPHRLDYDLIREKERIAGETGCYYFQYYMTLFMWAVEYMGWETFMCAAMEDPDYFDKAFLGKAFQTTMRDIEPLLRVEAPYVWLHDDLVSARGPMFRPEWYEEYIFPRYEKMFEKVHNAGKLVIHVADGNMDQFLERLYDLGADGVMVENPATDFDRAAEIFSDRILICGMDTKMLTFGTVDEIRNHVAYISRRTENIPGFTMCSPGGLHDNIPMENVEAYFDARVTYGFTKENWRRGDSAGVSSVMNHEKQY